MQNITRRTFLTSTLATLSANTGCISLMLGARSLTVSISDIGIPTREERLHDSIGKTVNTLARFTPNLPKGNLDILTFNPRKNRRTLLDSMINESLTKHLPKTEAFQEITTYNTIHSQDQSQSDYLLKVPHQLTEYGYLIEPRLYSQDNLISTSAGGVILPEEITNIADRYWGHKPHPKD